MKEMRLHSADSGDRCLFLGITFLPLFLLSLKRKCEVSNDSHRREMLAEIKSLAFSCYSYSNGTAPIKPAVYHRSKEQ